MATKTVRDLVKHYEDLSAAWSIHARYTPVRMQGVQNATMRSLSNASVHYLDVEAAVPGKPHFGVLQVIDSVQIPELIVSWTNDAWDKPRRRQDIQFATMRSLSDVPVHYPEVVEPHRGVLKVIATMRSLSDVPVHFADVEEPHRGDLKVIESVQIPEELIVAGSINGWNKPVRMQGIQFATMRSLSDVPLHFADVEELHRGDLKVIESVQIPEELIVAGSMQGIQFATMHSLSFVPAHYPEVVEPHRGVLKVIDFVQTTDSTPFKPETQSNGKFLGFDCLKHVARWLSHFFRLHRPNERSSPVRSTKRRV